MTQRFKSSILAGLLGLASIASTGQVWARVVSDPENYSLGTPQSDNAPAADVSAASDKTMVLVQYAGTFVGTMLLVLLKAWWEHRREQAEKAAVQKVDTQKESPKKKNVKIDQIRDNDE